MRFCLILVYLSLFITILSNAQRFELVWSDEFDGEKLNTNVWTPWYGTAYNNEDQFYTARDTNITVNDGYLHLVGLREKFAGRDWTSGRIKSQGNADFLYGKIEIRAKLPAGIGLWPAFWMMPTNSEYGSWPYSGEMDIMEYRGHQTNRTQGTVHFSRREYPGSGSANSDRRYISEEYIMESGSLDTEFHTYTYIWTDSTMSWYLDNIHFHTISKTEVLGQAEHYPFDKEFYIILNLAIGGNYLGDNQPNENTPNRNEVIVDYVRVYKDVNKVPDISIDYKSQVNIEPQIPFNLEANVTDPDENGSIKNVIFFLGDRKLVSFSEPPYSFNWTPKVDGCYPFKVTATDNDNGVSTSENLVIFKVGTGCEKRPFEDIPQQFPGVLELEYYDYGGFKNSYFDKTEFINTGNGIRTFEAVDISIDPNDSENYIITDTEDGEWLKYTIHVLESGIYNFELRAVPDGGSGRIDLKLNDEDWIYFTRINSTNEPYVYKSRNNINLESGIYDLEVGITQNGIKPDRISGSLVSTTVNSETIGTPDKIQLQQNYPNPFNPTTNILFSLDKISSVSLDIYNSLGQHITNLTQGRLTAGLHSYTFDGSNLGSGVYYYQLSSGNGETLTRKMILLK